MPEIAKDSDMNNDDLLDLERHMGDIVAAFGLPPQYAGVQTTFNFDELREHFVRIFWEAFAEALDDEIMGEENKCLK